MAQNGLRLAFCKEMGLVSPDWHRTNLPSGFANTIGTSFENQEKGGKLAPSFTAAASVRLAREGASNFMG